MTEWKRICCAVDFSEASRSTFAEAIELARRFEAELHLVHVFMPPPGLAPGVVSAQPLAQIAADGMERVMAGWRAEAEAALGATVRSHVVAGNPGDEIVRVARDAGCDLLVIGTHGRRGIPRIILGSVAEQIVRKAHCAVTVLRRPEEAHAA